MASSVSLQQLSHCFFSNTQTQVPFFLSVFVYYIYIDICTQLHIYVNSRLILYPNFGIYMKQLKDFKHGWSPRPSYFSTTDANVSIQPIRATAESPPFPLFQSTQVEESASEVKSHLCSFFRFFIFCLGLRENV